MLHARWKTDTIEPVLKNPDAVTGLFCKSGRKSSITDFNVCNELGVPYLADKYLMKLSVLTLVPGTHFTAGSSKSLGASHKATTFWLRRQVTISKITHTSQNWPALSADGLYTITELHNINSMCSKTDGHLQSWRNMSQKKKKKLFLKFLFMQDL